MFGRRGLAAVLAEFLGAGALTLLILSVQRSNIGVAFFVAIAAGVTYAFLVFAMTGISNGFYNPAITLGLAAIRRIAPMVAVAYIIVQMLGAWAAQRLYIYLSHTSLQDVSGHFAGRILVAEIVGTTILAVGIVAALYRSVTIAATAAFAGIALTVGMIAASPASIGVLNPAVALGIRSWEWGTYVLGSVVGGLLGALVYRYAFATPGVLPVEAAGVPAAAAVGAPVATSATTRANGAKKPRSAAKTARKTTSRRKK